MKLKLKTLLAYERVTGKNANELFAKKQDKLSFTDLAHMAFILRSNEDPTVTLEKIEELSMEEIGLVLNKSAEKDEATK